MSRNSFWLSVTYFHIELLIFWLSNFLVSPGTKLLGSPATMVPLVSTPARGSGSSRARWSRVGESWWVPATAETGAGGSPRSTRGHPCRGSTNKEPALAPLKLLPHQLAKRSKSCHQPLLLSWEYPPCRAGEVPGAEFGSLQAL